MYRLGKCIARPVFYLTSSAKQLVILRQEVCLCAKQCYQTCASKDNYNNPIMQEALQSYLFNTCDECGSEYYKSTSQMTNLCPQCACVLYGYENCNHQFENGRCKKCYWNGSKSAYLEAINPVEVYDSYKFSDGRIVAFLKSFRGKLPNQTILEDNSENRWKILQYFLTTGSIEAYEEKAKQEASNIFQYLIEGINQNEKPVKGAILTVVEAPNIALPK